MKKCLAWCASGLALAALAVGCAQGDTLSPGEDGSGGGLGSGGAPSNTTIGATTGSTTGSTTAATTGATTGSTTSSTTGSTTSSTTGSTTSSTTGSTTSSTTAATTAATTAVTTGGGLCGHDPCVMGTPLSSSCDTCALLVCDVLGDTVCCTSSWDDVCVIEAEVYCGCP